MKMNIANRLELMRSRRGTRYDQGQRAAVRRLLQPVMKVLENVRC